MAEENNANGNANDAALLTIALAAVVISFIYIYEVLNAENLRELLLAILIFAGALSYIYRKLAK